MGGVVELRGDDRAAMNPAVFEALSQQEAVVVLRNVPEIHELVRTLRVVAEHLDGAARAEEMAQALRNGAMPRFEALLSLHNAVRHLRDSRYISCLFSDLIGSLGLPKPLLIDSGFCRMAALQLWDEVSARQGEFAPDSFRKHPNEAEPMIGKTGWGNAHRDIDVSHYHYQVNFWFPLHDVGSDQTLLLFPEAYRRNVQQYEKQTDPQNPASWGYGTPLQIPLKLGDTLIFHSQQLHASPSQGIHKNRFTMEIRAASGCVDDNALTYRRLFWRIDNFQGSGDKPAAARAAELALEETGTSVDHALAGSTAHAVFHRLFRRPAASLAAGYVRRQDTVLDDAIVLDADAWARVIEKLEGLNPGEDLWLMVGRLLLRQKHRDLAVKVMARTYSHTRSYFWAMEVGRVAGEARCFDVAAGAFSVAEIRARGSDVVLERYAKGLPNRREGAVQQLLPRIALRAAVAFAKRARHEATQATGSTPTFDHHFFWPPWLAGSFEHYDIFGAGGLLAALPTGRAFNPELCLEDETAVVSEDPDVIGRALETKLGQRLQMARPAMGSVFSLGQHIVCQIFNGWYVIPRKLWESDPRMKQLADYNLLDFPGVCLIDARGIHPKTATLDFLPELLSSHAALAASLKPAKAS